MWNGLVGEDEVGRKTGFSGINIFQKFRNMSRSEIVEKEKFTFPKNTVDFFMSLNIYANFYTIIKQLEKSFKGS